jgi:putative heme transporter
VLLPELSWPHAVGADLAARAVASTIPGPTDLATRFVLYRQWQIPADRATAGIAFAAVFEPLSSLVLPLIGTIGLILTGHLTQRVVVVAAIGLMILVVAVALIVEVVRSESFARRIGNGLDWLARHTWTLVHRTPPAGIVDGVIDFRERAKDILAGHGLLAFAAAVLAKLAWFVVLEVSLVAVGLTPAVLPPAAVLTAMAVVGIVALVPITPGAVGVSEVAYIGILTSVAGVEATEQITAAVMLFRIAQWLAVIPIGWVLLVIMRGGHLAELLGDDSAAAAEGRNASATT